MQLPVNRRLTVGKQLYEMPAIVTKEAHVHKIWGLVNATEQKKSWKPLPCCLLRRSTMLPDGSWTTGDQCLPCVSRLQSP